MSAVRAAPPHVGRARAFGQHGLDGPQDGVGRLLPGGVALPQVFQHQGRRPDLPDRIGDAPARDVRRGAVHGLEQGRMASVRVQVGRRRDADRAGAGRPQVGQDVAEQVRGHDHVEAVGVLHQVGAEDVDVEFVPGDVGIFQADGGDAFVPERHGDGDAVGFRGRRQVAARPPGGQFEGVAQDPVGAGTGEHRFLDGDFPVGAGEQAAARVGVFALGVFAHHQEVDVAGQPAGQRAGHAGHQPRRPQVDVLVELAADGDDGFPDGDVVRHPVGRAHGAEQDGVVPADAVLPVGRHHAAFAQVMVAAPVEGFEGQSQAEPGVGGFQYPQAFRHDFHADAVAGDHCDLSCHAGFLVGWTRAPDRVAGPVRNSSEFWRRAIAGKPDAAPGQDRRARPDPCDNPNPCAVSIATPPDFMLEHQGFDALRAARFRWIAPGARAGQYSYRIRETTSCSKVRNSQDGSRPRPWSA